MNTDFDRDLMKHLGSFISAPKQQTIDKVLKYRTKHITIVLEDIFQTHNASAVVRSCDCFGIQDLHIIENNNEYTLNPNVTQGSSKWVDINRYNDSDSSNTKNCLNQLEVKGYTIFATSPNATGLNIEQIPVEGKTALLFGTELNGLSGYALERAHQVVSIPMFGFTESYNLSVSVALCLHSLINKLHQSQVQWNLTDSEMEEIKLRWYRRSVRNSEILEKAFYDKWKSK